MTEKMQRQITFVGRIEDFDADDQALEYWMTRTYEEKLAEEWSLTMIAYQLKGQDVSKLRLQGPFKFTERKRR